MSVRTVGFFYCAKARGAMLGQVKLTVLLPLGNKLLKVAPGAARRLAQAAGLADACIPACGRWGCCGAAAAGFHRARARHGRRGKKKGQPLCNDWPFTWVWCPGPESNW